MEYYVKAKEVMDMDATEFVGGVSEAEIESAMEKLAVSFPESYKAFLRDFGGGDAGGEIIFGLTEDEEDMVAITSMEREVNLPKEYIIIAFWCDALVCLDTGKMSHGECPVVELDDDYCVTKVLAESFGKFLYDYVSEE